jgi:hypothetical protein
MDTQGIQVVERTKTIGFVSLVEAAPTLDDTELMDRLQAQALTGVLPIPGEQSDGALFRRILNRIRGRELVRDFGEHQVEVTWLELHVPPGGSAHFVATDTTRTESGMKLSVAGSGYGDAASISFSIRKDFNERRNCVRLFETFTVRIRDYAYKGETGDVERRVDIIEQIGNGVDEWARCPMCGLELAEIDELLFERAGPSINLANDAIGLKRTDETVLTGKSEFEIGFSISVPGIADSITAGVSIKRDFNLKCLTSYFFAPKTIYHPLRHAGSVELPFWGVNR